ncbi:MAG: threonine synthase [Magnetococcales bacterium]|nr:threonine synthase [Magnetococcales bacterium]
MTLRYISTRGQIDPCSFSQAVLMGLATDGGLLLPEAIPQVTARQLRHWATLPFAELAAEVIRPFADETDLPNDDLRRLCQRSFASFSHPAVTPVVRVGGRAILELFHGPTLAFKDVALQWLGNLFEYILTRDGGFLTILGATSGDTGSAAIHGVRGRAGIQIFILHPHQRVSPIQERQMTTVLDSNVHNVAVRGSFDDGQRIVKALFNDLPFRDQYRLGAINSINWARILAQMVYYFSAWGQMTGGDPQRPLSFAVPTGNFGDIFAGYMAHRMGLPVERLILATNRNDILSRFFQTGRYGSDTAVATLSPSMDIQRASNFERYLYYLLDQDGAEVARHMAELERSGEMRLPEAKRVEAARLFTARAVSDAETLEQIRRFHQETGYLLDPHTAVGMCAATEFPDALSLATAHPAKFGEAVRQAIGQEPELPASLAGLLEKPSRCAVLEADPEVIKAHIITTLAAA